MKDIKIQIKVKDNDGNVISYHNDLDCIRSVIEYLQSLGYVSYYGNTAMPSDSGLENFGPGYISKDH